MIDVVESSPAYQSLSLIVTNFEERCADILPFFFVRSTITKLSCFQESEIYQKCVRAPPNRTVFDSESPPPYRTPSSSQHLHSGLLDMPGDRVTRSQSPSSSNLLLNTARSMFKMFPSHTTPSSTSMPVNKPPFSSYSESSSNVSSNLSSSNLSNITVVPCETDESRQEQQQQQQQQPQQQFHQKVWSAASSFLDAVVVIVAAASSDFENERSFSFSRSFCATATTTTMPFKTDSREKLQHRINSIGRVPSCSSTCITYTRENIISSRPVVPRWIVLLAFFCNERERERERVVRSWPKGGPAEVKTSRLLVVTEKSNQSSRLRSIAVRWFAPVLFFFFDRENRCVVAAVVIDASHCAIPHAASV